jgi:glycosyltransferase involved in cell wall biosynthesis
MAQLTDRTAPVRLARLLVYIAAVTLGAYAFQVFGLPVFDWLFFVAAALAVAFAFCSASGGRVSFTGRRANRELLQDGSKQPRIAVIYHYFPHYRKGIFRELARVLDVTFVGDGRAAKDDIPRLAFGDGTKSIQARCYRVGTLLIQPRAISLAMFGRFDVFVYLANPWFVSTWCAAVICRLRGKRVVFWGHGFVSNNERLRNVVRATYYSLANGFYSYGYRSKIIAKRFRFKAKSLYVGYNSLDYLAQIGLRQRCLADPGLRPTPQQASRWLRVLCISRLSEACRYDVLLRAAARARESDGLNVIIAFFGDGPARPALEALADELGVWAVFNGAVYDNAVLAPLIYSADVTVSPGKVGLTAIHSLMFGTPVISHRDFDSQMPEVESLVEGYSGMLFDKNDAGDLARALVDFRRVFPDRERTRENCFAVVDRFYNPAHQRRVFLAAVQGLPAEEGDDMLRLFPLKQAGENA